MAEGQYSAATLETHIDITKASELEKRFRKTDLLYALFTAPDDAFTQKLIGYCLTAMEKKNESTLKGSRMFREGLEFYRSEYADSDVRTWAFLMILARDVDVQKTVRGIYKPGNPWGEDAQRHFDAFIPCLNNIANQLMNWPISEPNVVPTVRNFVLAAHEAYMTTYH